MRLLGPIVAGLMMAGVTTAQEMEAPRIAMSPVDWDVAAATLSDRPAGAPAELFARLNEVSAQRFAGIGLSPVPVLLPFDLAAYGKDKNAGKAEAATSDAYFAGFHPSKFFLAGPSGYDATFTIKPREAGIALTYDLPVEVEIGGAAFVYQLDGPGIAEVEGSPRELQEKFPGIRRIIREAHVRYAFERFGVPYVVSIECFDIRPKSKRLACREADKVALKFLAALQTVGGTPATPHQPQIDLARPATASLSFTYFAPGNLIANSGYKEFGGRADRHVYAHIRFPLAEAPAYPKSQSFNPWGDCYMKGRVGRIKGKDSPYHCKLNDRPLTFDEAAAVNFSYPWRDNFCETRDTQVGQCPGGWGHQGQDIRPSSCVLHNKGADRCEPYQHDVVAARDGMIWRTAGMLAVYVVANAADARVRLRYMHMNPNFMDADGLLSGRRVRQGEVIGKLANYGDHERGTSYHLHFDVQVFTRDGWVWVNPFMTLVAGYERLIGARGVEIKDGEPEPKAAARIAPIIATAAVVTEQGTAARPKTPHKVVKKKRPRRKHRNNTEA